MRIWCGPFSRLTWHFNNLLWSDPFSSAVLPWLTNWYFWIGPGPPGAQKQPKGPYWGHPQEKQIDDLKATEISFVLPFGFSGFINGPATEFHPVAFGRFQPFSRTHFGSGTPKTGPNRLFVLQTQPSYGKRVTLEFSRLMHKHIKQPGYSPFFAQNQFSYSLGWWCEVAISM